MVGIKNNTHFYIPEPDHIPVPWGPADREGMTSISEHPKLPKDGLSKEEFDAVLRLSPNPHSK